MLQNTQTRVENKKYTNTGYYSTTIDYHVNIDINPIRTGALSGFIQKSWPLHIQLLPKMVVLKSN